MTNGTKKPADRQRRLTARAAYSCICAAFLLLICPAPCPAQDATVEAVLKAKGLNRSGTTYLLDTDIKLFEDLRIVHAAKVRMDESDSKRSSIESEIKRLTDELNKLTLESNDVTAKLNKAKSVANKNQYIDQHNEIARRVRAADDQLQARIKDMSRIPDLHDDYAIAVIGTSDKMEVAMKQYTALAADRQVIDALAHLNEKATPKVTLGPSAQFAQQLTFLRAERKNSVSVIHFQPNVGVAVVNVTLNGRLIQPMIVDSGASSVCIPADVAAKLGIKITDKTPTVKAHIANGKTVESRVVTLKSVKVGPFRVENVQCMVIAASEKHAPCLLGTTFLEHFSYRMDLKAGTLQLSPTGFNDVKLEAPDQPDVATDGAGKPNGTLIPAPRVAKGAAPSASKLSPAIVVSSTNDIRIANLAVGAPRLYDSSPLRTIEVVSGTLRGYQFTAIPQRIVISYDVEIKKAGLIYVFGFGKGPKATPPETVFGSDLSRWESCDAEIQGTNVTHLFRRKVTAGEKFHLSGFEISIAAESIASPAEAARVNSEPVTNGPVPPTPTTQPAEPALAAGWVDLFKDFDPKPQDAEMQRDATGITVKSSGGRLVVPAVTSGAYEMHLRFMALADSHNGLEMLVPVGSSACRLKLGGNDHKQFGIGYVDGHPPKEPVLLKLSDPISAGREHNFDLRVTLQGDMADLTLRLDTLAPIHWSGRQTSLTGFKNSGDKTRPFEFYIKDAHVRLITLRVHVLSGELKPSKGTSGGPETE